MTPELWQRVKSVFDSVSELPADERQAFLEKNCAGDPVLRAEVESLLDSLGAAENFIESPVVPPVAKPMRGGTTIGPYRIVQVLGEGGMGTVYQAVRVDDLYRKLVAIKVIKAGLNSDFAIRKFETERQILAHLDHPNITKLLDGGTTQEGWPYFVMDFIAGTPIDEYCDQKQLPITERLRLFLTVCSAVHCAHQNLIVHRDLKPQNILIAEDGAVRLLDFGIAKLLDGEEGRSVKLASTVLMVTPQYASPEQLNGEPVTTATDVYSLGVLLYQLLTGRTPYQLKNRSSQEIFEKIRGSEPRRPSTVVRCDEEGTLPGSLEFSHLTAERLSNLRGVKPDKLARQLSGDLDNILLLALRKEPQRRYASVEQFASDIRRHLENIPVLARPDTLRYRSIKFVKRHTGAVVAGTLFALALMAGIAATSWEAKVARGQRERAEQRFNEVRELANAVLFDLHDAIEPLPGSTAVRQLLITKAQHYLDHLAADPGSDDTLNRERAAAYERIGDVLGLPIKANLGNTKGALDSYERALELERSVLAEHPGDQKARAAIARTLSRVCSVEQSTGSFQNALKHCGETVRIESELAAADPGDAAREAELGSTYQNMAGAWFAVGNWRESEDYRARALAVFEQLHKSFPSNENYEFELANACLRMANVEEQQHQFQPARLNAERAVAMFGDLSARHPSQVRRKLSTTYALQRLGSVLISLGDLKGAQEAFERSLPIREQLLALDPLDASARVNLSNTLAALGYVELQMGNPKDASLNFERQREIAGKLVAADPLRIEHQYSLSEAMENIGKVSLFFANRSKSADVRRRRAAEAKTSLLQALRIYEVLRERGAISAEYASVPKRIEEELGQCDQLMRNEQS